MSWKNGAQLPKARVRVPEHVRRALMRLVTTEGNRTKACAAIHISEPVFEDATSPGATLRAVTLAKIEVELRALEERPARSA